MPQGGHLIRCGGACGSPPSPRCAWAAPPSASSRPRPKTTSSPPSATGRRSCWPAARTSCSPTRTSRDSRARAHARDRARRRLLESRPGEPWDESSRTRRARLAGIECLSGIPGSTGATPIQNVGAYGQDVSQTIAWVRAYDRETDAVRDDERRRSAASSTATACSSTTTAGPCSPSASGCAVRALRPAHLRRAVPHAGRAGRWARAARRGARRRAGLRRGKGMVIDPGDPDSVSAGSFFTNPILSHEAWAAIPGDPPGWPEPDGRIKTSAAWLIERAGLPQGVRRRTRRDLHQAHARARQSRRRDHGRADGAGPRDRRGCAGAVRRRPAPGAGAGRPLAGEKTATPPLKRVDVSAPSVFEWRTECESSPA